HAIHAQDLVRSRLHRRCRRLATDRPDHHAAAVAHHRAHHHLAAHRLAAGVRTDLPDDRGWTELRHPDRHSIHLRLRLRRTTDRHGLGHGLRVHGAHHRRLHRTISLLLPEGAVT